MKKKTKESKQETKQITKKKNKIDYKKLIKIDTKGRGFKEVLDGFLGGKNR
jgi:hypothetical protein